MSNENDFLAVLADAIQQHEGWNEGDLSFLNYNPGDLKFVGQEHATGDAKGFCVFPDYYTGKDALWHDLSLKLHEGEFLQKSIRDLISRYAPPEENNTEAYIAAVIAFFRARNWSVDDNSPIQNLIQKNAEKPSIVVCLNNLSQPNQAGNVPGEWAHAQRVIEATAAQMPQFCFSARESNINLQPFIAKIGVTLGDQAKDVFAVSIEENQKILQSFNEGQEFNVLMFNTKGLTFPDGLMYGGLTDSTLAVSYAHPSTEFGQVCFQESWGDDFLSRALFHELIHGIFVRTGDEDTLHQYLIAHSGYNTNALADLQVVYGQESARFFALHQAVNGLLQQEIGILLKLKDWLIAELTHRQNQPPSSQ